MKKNTILYDINVFEGALHNNSSRSGIFTVAWQIFIEFTKRDDINLILYSDSNILKELKEYLENSGYKGLKYATKPAKDDSKRPPIRRVRTFLRWCLLQSKIFLGDLTGFGVLSVSKLKCDFYFTASLWQYNGIYFKYEPLKFAVGYDLMPLIFPEYYPNEEWKSKFEAFDNYFAISEYTKKDFLHHLPHLKPQNIIVTPLACDERFKIENSAAIAEARKKYNIPENKKYIFSLCTLEPRKNLIRAVKCFASFIRKNNIDDLVFVLGGAHWDRFISILEGEIENLSELKDKILKIGYVDDADQAALYSGALFFVYTSQYEGFGLPPLEAMSCGVPVITSNNSSLPEVVGDAGIMIDYDDDQAHIKAYEDYYFNENLRAENSKKGLERAKKFSWEKCADIMVAEMKRRANG